MGTPADCLEVGQDYYLSTFPDCEVCGTFVGVEDGVFGLTNVFKTIKQGLYSEYPKGFIRLAQNDLGDKMRIHFQRPKI